MEGRTDDRLLAFSSVFPVPVHRRERWQGGWASPSSGVGQSFSVYRGDLPTWARLSDQGLIPASDYHRVSVRCSPGELSSGSG